MHFIVLSLHNIYACIVYFSLFYDLLCIITLFYHSFLVYIDLYIYNSFHGFSCVFPPFFGTLFVVIFTLKSLFIHFFTFHSQLLLFIIFYFLFTIIVIIIIIVYIQFFISFSHFIFFHTLYIFLYIYFFLPLTIHLLFIFHLLFLIIFNILAYTLHIFTYIPYQKLLFTIFFSALSSLLL